MGIAGLPRSALIRRAVRHRLSPRHTTTSSAQLGAPTCEGSSFGALAPDGQSAAAAGSPTDQVSPLRSSALRSRFLPASRLRWSARRQRLRSAAPDRSRSRRAPSGTRRTASPTEVGRSPVGLVMDENVEAVDIAVGDRHHLERETVCRLSLSPFVPLAIEHRLAVLEPDQRIGRGLLAGEVFEGAIVVDDAVLVDLDEARALVLVGALQDVGDLRLGDIVGRGR